MKLCTFSTNVPYYVLLPFCINVPYALLETYKAMDIPRIAILLLDIYKQKDYIAVIISI